MAAGISARSDRRAFVVILFCPMILSLLLKNTQQLRPKDGPFRAHGKCASRPEVPFPGLTLYRVASQLSKNVRYVFRREFLIARRTSSRAAVAENRTRSQGGIGSAGLSVLFCSVVISFAADWWVICGGRRGCRFCALAVAH